MPTNAAIVPEPAPTEIAIEWGKNPGEARHGSGMRTGSGASSDALFDGTEDDYAVAAFFQHEHAQDGVDEVNPYGYAMVRDVSIDDTIRGPRSFKIVAVAVVATEASWRVRGNDQVDVYTAMREEHLRTPDLRLTSSEYTVKSSDQRWKDRGAGFRTAADPKLQLSASNTEHLGALEDRLHELQKDTTAWLGRDNWDVHTKQKFLDDVKEEDDKQEKIEKERAAILAKIESDQASEKAENTRINAKIEEKRAQDAFTSREKAKGSARIQASAQTPKEYLPHTEQENRKKAKQAVVDSAMEKKMAALKMKEQEKEAKEAKKNETNMAKGKASKFIRKMC